jgi:hypothetical protein
MDEKKLEKLASDLYDAVHSEFNIAETEGGYDERDVGEYRFTQFILPILREHLSENPENPR